MTQEEQKREEIIQTVSNLMRTTTFSFEFKVVKKSHGIKIIYEVTREEMDVLQGMMTKE